MMTQLKVMKFGGTSVGKPERMRQVSQLITADRTQPTIVVLSALSGTTNALVEIGNAISAGQREKAKELIDKLEAHYQSFVNDLVKTGPSLTKARAIVAEHFEFLTIILRISFSEALSKDILAQGELLSTKLFSVFLEENGIDHSLLPALEFMSIDAHDEPQINTIKTKLTQLLQQHKDKSLFITQGYICRNARGEVDNLKRGGSDYSASLIAAAINASVCEIWTDIDGMHNNDPRVVKKTVAIEQLSFEEAAELAYFGAKVLHPATILPAVKKNIPVLVLNSRNPTNEGTRIISLAPHCKSPFKSIAVKKKLSIIDVVASRMLMTHGYLKEIFTIFDKHQCPVDMVSTSEVSVSLTVDSNDKLPLIAADLSHLADVKYEGKKALVCMVGEDIRGQNGMAAQVFNAIRHINVRMMSQGASEINMSFMIDEDDADEAVRSLHAAFFKDPDPLIFDVEAQKKQLLTPNS
jgi:aspartate kinase